MKPCPVPNHVHVGVVHDTHDGDTTRVVLDLDFHVGLTEPMRLYGINCPELSTPAGKAAADFVQQLMPVGTTVTVQSHKNPDDSIPAQEKYGRWLADIWLPDGRHLNQLLLDAGHAVVYFGGAK